MYGQLIAFFIRNIHVKVEGPVSVSEAKYLCFRVYALGFARQKGTSKQATAGKQKCNVTGSETAVGQEQERGPKKGKLCIEEDHQGPGKKKQ